MVRIHAIKTSDKGEIVVGLLDSPDATWWEVLDEAKAILAGVLAITKFCSENTPEVKPKLVLASVIKVFKQPFRVAGTFQAMA